MLHLGGLKVFHVAFFFYAGVVSVFSIISFVRGAIIIFFFLSLFFTMEHGIEYKHRSIVDPEESGRLCLMISPNYLTVNKSYRLYCRLDPARRLPAQVEKYLFSVDS